MHSFQLKPTSPHPVHPVEESAFNMIVRILAKMHDLNRREHTHVFVTFKLTVKLGCCALPSTAHFTSSSCRGSSDVGFGPGVSAGTVLIHECNLWRSPAAR